MKSILLGDTHLGYKNSNKFWLNLTFDLFKEITDYCVINNIKSIIHLGDWFHTRYSINVLSIDISYKIINLLKENNIHIYIIKGNHDSYYKNQENPHSLLLFNKYDNVTVVDQSLELDDEILCPWNTIPENTDKKILLGHYEINGIQMNSSGNTMKNGKLNISDFKQFDKVYSGHFHTRSKNSNIEYIGSSFAMDFNDVNSTRGYYVYEKGETEFIEFKDAPKFILFTDQNKFDTIDIKDNICKLIMTKTYTESKASKILDEIRSYSPKEFYFDFNIVEENKDEKIFIGTNPEIIDYYVQNVHILSDGLNKEVLLKYIKKLEI